MGEQQESGINQHPGRERLEAFVRGELSGAELLETGDHIAECGSCADSVAEPEMIFARIEDGADGAHLSEDEIRSIAEGKSEPPAHLAECELCTIAVDDLVTLRQDIQAMDDPTAVGSEAPRSWLKWLLVPAFGLVAAGAILFWFVWDGPSAPTAEINVAEPDTVGEAGPTPPSDNRSEGPEASPRPAGMELVDGGRVISIDEEGRVAGVDSPIWARKARLALERGEIRIDNSAKDLEGASGALMGRDDPGVPFRLITPVGSHVESQSPNFRWETVEGADSYRVEVFDGNFNKVATGENIGGNSWTPPNPLTRGVIYSWQVIARVGDEEVRSPVRPAPDAQFKVIGADAARSIAEARRSGSALLMGLAYAEAGLIREAEAQLIKLRKQNPKSREVAELLRKLRAAR